MNSSNTLDPAIFCDDDIRVLFNDVGLRIELGNFFRRADGRATFVAVFVAQFAEFIADDAPQLFLGGEQSLDAFCFCPFFFQFLHDPINFQFGNSVQSHIEDRIDLDFINRKDFHQSLRGIGFALTAANDFQSFIEPIENNLEAFENVNSLEQLSQQVFETASDRLQAELQKVAEQFLQIDLSRFEIVVFIGNQTGRIEVEVQLQRGVLIQIRHHGFGIIGTLEFEHDAHAEFFAALIDRREQLR